MRANEIKTSEKPARKLQLCLHVGMQAEGSGRKKKGKKVKAK
jgi:hypothetical protein